MLNDLLHRLRSLIFRRKSERDLDEELRFHFDHQVSANLKSGMTAAEARRQARLKFGALDEVKEECRDARGVSLLTQLLQDARFALRTFAKNPGFTAIAILTLALGIGTNTAIFSYIDAWLIKGLPYPHGEQLVVIEAHDRQKGWTSDVTTPGDYYSLLEQSSALQSAAGCDPTDFNLVGDGATPERIAGARVNWSFFDTLGVQPILGRAFQPSDDAPGAPHVVMLSRGLWASRFAADPHIINRAITINGESYTVIGVAPANFQYPMLGVANLWTPMAWTDSQRASREGAGYIIVGRLKDAVSLRQANSQFAAIAHRLEQQYPATNQNEDFFLTPLRDEILRNEGGDQIIVCFWIVGLVLLIACVNVANLMLAKASGRAKEIAVRRALGATPRRIARQLLTESVILFSLGGLAGLLFGVVGMYWIDSLVPDRVRGYLVNYGHVQLDLVTLAYTLGIASLCGIIFGLAPALQTGRTDLNRTLKESSAQASVARRSSRTRRIFVIAEIAVAVVVLISTALLVQDFVRMRTADPGFRPANLITAQLELPRGKYPSDAQIRAFFAASLERMRALPRVHSATISQFVPFSGSSDFAKTYRADRPVPTPNDMLFSDSSAVAPDYFSTMGIALHRGRAFTAADAPGAAPVVIVNDRLAQQLWPDSDPVGQQLAYGENGSTATVVGVVANVKMYQMNEKPRRQFYIPFAQSPSRLACIIVGTAATDAELPAAMRNAIWSIDAQQPVAHIEYLSSLIKDSLAGELVVSQLVSFFGALALFLGAIGIYGVMAHAVSQRTCEIGIRLALGAKPTQIVELVVREGLRLALIGIIAGALLALVVTRSMASILFEVNPRDPLLFTLVALLFAVVAVAASTIPALRALRVDPTTALRYE